MIDTDTYEGHTENKWEWYEFGDGDWILCPLHEDVIATDDWYVDAETGEHIESHDAIWNWDDAILSLQSNCITDEHTRCVPSRYRFGENRADHRLITDAPLLFAEVKRLREVILDFSLPMWNYLNSQVHIDAEEYTAHAVKSLVKNTPYESLMHLWEDACGYLPNPDCDDTPRNKPVWNREMIE